MKKPRKNHGFSRVQAFDAVWKSCQSIELATAKMCAAKSSIYAALLESFVRPLGSIGGPLGDLCEAIWSSGEIPELLYSLVKSSHVRSRAAKSAQGGSKSAQGSS